MWCSQSFNTVAKVRILKYEGKQNKIFLFFVLIFLNIDFCNIQIKVCRTVNFEVKIENTMALMHKQMSKRPKTYYVITLFQCVYCKAMEPSTVLKDIATAVLG